MRPGFLLPAQNPKPKPSSSPPTPNPKPKPQILSEIGSNDRLSSLPDPILHQILALLPTDEMVRTSALSRRWARLWTRSPVLHFTRCFTSDSIEPEDYPAITDRCLAQCTGAAHKLTSVRFPLSKSPAFRSTAYRWIRFAAARSVERLTFTSSFFGRFRVEIPPSLFRCRSLTSLSLNSCSLSSIPSPEPPCFPLLTSLSFTRVTLRDGELDALLASSPRIESLSLSSIQEITRIAIRAPTLRHLMIYGCRRLKRVDVMEAPELRRFMYCGDLSKVRSLQKGAAPRLEEALLLSSTQNPFEDEEMRERFILSIAHVKVLSVSSWFFQCTLGRYSRFEIKQSLFPNLKDLHWWPVYLDSPDKSIADWSADRISAYSLHALFSILQCCPSIEQLCILCTYNLESEIDEFERLSDSSCEEFEAERQAKLLAFPEFEGVGYELPSLKTVRIAQFSGRNEEMKLVEFLLKKAVHLESVRLHYVGEIEETLNEIRRQIGSFDKTSPIVDLSFLLFDDEKACDKHERSFFSYMVI